MTQDNHRAAKAALGATADFWAELSLDYWEQDPRESFKQWMAQMRVLGIHNLRESTLETYLAMFSTWQRFLTDRQLTLLEATSAEARAFFTSHQLEPVSRRRYLQLLDKMYHHLIGIGLSRSNPMSEEFLYEDALPEHFPQGLNAQELKRFIDHLEGDRSWRGARDRAMAAYAIGSGLRTSALIELAEGADMTTWVVNVPAVGIHKGYQTLLLPDFGWDSITFPWRRWVLEWEELKSDVPGQLMIPATRSGSPYSRSGVFRRIKGILEKAEIELPQRGASVLRNTFARLAFCSGRYEAYQIQEFMGHENMRATQRYAFDSEEMLNEKDKRPESQRNRSLHVGFS